MTRFPYLICLFWFFSAAARSQSIIAYYSGDAKSIDRYPVQQLTDIIFSFGHLKGSRFRISGRSDSAAIRKLVNLKKKNPSLKVLLSLGGWGGCRTCSAVFSSAAGREAFARSVCDCMQYFKTDGIDIDWEFPTVKSYPGHPFSAVDKNNLTALLRALRKSLGNSKKINLSAAGFSPYLQQSYNWRKLSLIVDRINLMTYDLIGSRNKFTGHHSSLYSTSWQEASADHAVRYLDSLHVPLNKIAIGVAFYARQFNVVNGKHHGLHQPGHFVRFLSMKQIRKSYRNADGFIEYWDDQAKASYRFNQAKKIFLTYDDARSVTAKTKYVKEKGLAGIIFWELRLDRPENGLLDNIYEGFRQ